MPHLQNFLSILSLLGVAHLLKIGTPLTAGLSIFHASIITCLILYVGALADLLPETALGIRVVGMVGIALLLIDMFKSRARLNAEIIFMVVTMAGFYLLCQTTAFRSFSQVDDFGYWGRLSRYMAEQNTLLGRHESIRPLDYPPIAALFQYFFVHFSGFEDRIAIFAQGILIISGTSLLIRPISTATRVGAVIWACLSSLSIYSLYWIFSSWFMTVSLGTLSVDLLLGISFGLTWHVYYSLDQQCDSSKRIGAAVPIILFIILLKPIGILFAAISICVIFLDYLKMNQTGLRWRLTTSVAICISILIFYATWKIYLSKQGINPTFPTTFTFTDIFNAFNFDLATQRQVITITNFLNQIFFSFDRTTYWFLISFSLLAVIFFISKHAKIKFSILPYLFVYAGLCVYLAALLVLYLFSFSEWEGTRLASIDRYTKTYIIGVLVFFGGRIIFLANGRSLNWSLKLGVSLLSLLLIAPNLGYVTRDIKRIVFKQDPSYVDRVVAVADQVLLRTPSNAKIYFVYSDGSNDESGIFNYLITPRTSNSNCSFIRPPDIAFSDSQPWACALSLDDFRAKITSFDFVVLAKVSQEFIDYYLSPMKIQFNITQPIFSIERSSEKILLVPVIN